MAKIALVTGGMGGLGVEMCKALANSGHMVIATYSGNEEKRKEFAAKTKVDGFAFKVYKCDVASFESCANAVNTIKKEVGNIDILVNNAGITRDGTLRKMTVEDWNNVINTNL